MGDPSAVGRIFVAGFQRWLVVGTWTVAAANGVTVVGGGPVLRGGRP